MRISLTESPGVRLRLEKSEISLLGARETNQDSVAIVVTDAATLAVVCDGMGGHSDGARAAAITEQTLCKRFEETERPLLDPLGFLHLALGAAHQKVVLHSITTPVETRARATCAACIIQDGSAYWAHVGDSRIYLIRGGQVLQRTRDHSHVELLLREGLIQADEMQAHPMRNFVESCIGGEALLPEMSIGPRVALQASDLILICTDGLWGSVPDAELAAAVSNTTLPLQDALTAVAERAVRAGGAAADNTSAIAIRILE
jgi:PPM family protein phosphatase